MTDPADLREALQRIRDWAEAYPVDMFIPVSHADMERAHRLLNEAGINLGAIHGQWARHILDGIGGIARDALKVSEL